MGKGVIGKILGTLATVGLLAAAFYAGFWVITQAARILTVPALRDEMLGAVQTNFGDFITLTLSILVEAFPFVVLGVLISVVIQVFLPTDMLLRRLPKNIVARRAIISFLGVAMPVCECGNVPVARGLMAKGLNPTEAVVFLLTAPSVNVITFIVTYEAFNQSPSMAIARVVLTVIIANVVALLVAKMVARRTLLTPEFAAQCSVDHHGERSLPRAASLFRSEMWLIARLLVIGAMIAAASQVFIPRDIITAIGSNVVLSVLAMLLLAFVVSICSSVDAFFALAYANTFGLGAILAFLVAGPMVDIKMIALLKSTFTNRTILVITLGVFTLAFIAGVGFSYVW